MTEEQHTQRGDTIAFEFRVFPGNDNERGIKWSQDARERGFHLRVWNRRGAGTWFDAVAMDLFNGEQDICGAATFGDCMEGVRQCVSVGR